MNATLAYKPKKELLLYLLKFGGFFCLLYFGTLGIIGLSTPDNVYSPFVARYLNFVDPLRASLLLGAKAFLALLGYRSYLPDRFTLTMDNGSAVRMVYSCIGYGVMSFWGAFVLANAGTAQKKISWLFGGLAMLWVINVLRIGLLVLANSRGWAIPLGWDHHTWFNIVAYGCIFMLIYFYDRSFKQRSTAKAGLDN